MIDEKITELKLPYPGGDDRLVRVYVPAHEEGETIPVIYMTDGQNLFDEEHATYGCWYTREAVRAERNSSGKAAVIVGVHNDGSPVDRANDLTPGTIGEVLCPPQMRSLLDPRGEVFADFVVNTVMPAVEERFPVQSGRENTAFCGSSSGGLEAFFIALSYPDVFCAAGVFSPCFMFYTPDDLFKWIRGRLGDNMPYLYLYSGAGDEHEKVICMSTEQTYDMLVECYPPESLNEVILMDQPHHEKAWAQIFPDFLHTFLSKSSVL